MDVQMFQDHLLERHVCYFYQQQKNATYYSFALRSEACFIILTITAHTTATTYVCPLHCSNIYESNLIHAIIHKVDIISVVVLYGKTKLRNIK